MAGYTAFADLELGSSVRAKINTQFTELFGENAKALVAVADAAALAAIPAEYVVTGKIVYQIDTAVFHEWNGSAWAEKTGPLKATTVTVSGAIHGASGHLSGALQVDGMSNLDGGATVTPASDIPAATFRRNAANQTSLILQIQAQDNAPLADCDKDGVWHGAGVDVSGAIAAGGDISTTGALEGATAAIVGLSQGGTGKFGDVTGGDFTEFEADGTMKANGAATTWKDLIIPGLALRGGGSAPTFAAFQGGIYALRFDAGSANEAHGSVELQHDYKEGTDLILHVHWAPSTTNGGNIVWGAEYSVAPAGTTYPATTTQAGTPTAAPGVAKRHAMYDIVTISGTGLKIGAVLIFRIYRQNGGTDTFTGNAFLLSAGVHYEADTLGSRAITTK